MNPDRFHQGARRHTSRAQRQRGVTLMYGLLALLIMMVGAAAMVRSMNTSMLISGNLAFKRDLTNQAERAAAQVMPQLQTGALAAEATRQSNQVNLNYSATLLPTNDQGMPAALVDSTAFAARGSTANDITVTDQGVVLRVLAPQVEPAMQLLQQVWATWRQAAWGLKACEPRVWRL